MAASPPQQPGRPSSSSGPSSLTSLSASPFRSQLFAQEMNNSAASCIEVGLYSRAVTSLTRALSLSRRQQPPRESVCTCHNCSLDGCIVRSRVVGRVSASLGEEDESANEDDSTNDNQNEPNNYIIGGSYLTRKPIRVECQGHLMGPALYLVITFNLALTNHLMALSTHTTPERSKRANKALELYKLTYEMQANILHHESEKDPPLASPAFAASIRSIRFEMMILNNTSQVHKKLTRNPVEHQQCLRRLLSTMMIVVDHHVRIATAEGAVPIDPIWQIDMDGFLKNTIYLILGNIYTSGVA